MIIGNFRIEDGSYRGDITTLSLHRANVVLRPTSKTGEREPDCRIVQVTETGTVDLGAARKRRSEGGREFLSIVLDAALPSAVNAPMFMADHEDTATLVWQRSVKKAAATAEPKLSRSRVGRAANVPGPDPA